MATIPVDNADFDYNYGVPTYTKNVARGKNPNYMVSIQSTSGIQLIADVSEQVMISISNTWEPRFAAGLADYFGMNVTGVIGENILYQEFGRLMWMSTTPIEIPITLYFDAYEDAYEDVKKPMLMLETLFLPTKVGGWLMAPGPSPLYPNRNKITMTIGRSWYFDSIVGVSVSNTYDLRLDARGYPISGQSEIVFSTDRIMSKQEWLQTDIKG